MFVVHSFLPIKQTYGTIDGGEQLMTLLVGAIQPKKELLLSEYLEQSRFYSSFTTYMWLVLLE